MTRNQTRKKKRSLSKRNKTKYRWQGQGGRGRIADREQTTDFVFYEPTLNKDSGYVKYIVVNQPPSYLNMFDALSYQFMEVNELLHALSQNKTLIPDYVVHKRIKTNRARTKAEEDYEKTIIDKKKKKLKEKLQNLEEEDETE